MNDIHSLAHSKWNCKYHIVFAPKYRRKTMFGAKGREIGAILRELCKWKGVNIIEAEICPDHVHMLVEIPPKMSVSGFVSNFTFKSMLNEGSTALPFRPYFSGLKNAYLQSVKSTGRNLLPISSTASLTTNGVTFTNNEDGTWLISGTATQTASVVIYRNAKISYPSGKYTLTKNSNAGNSSAVQLNLATRIIPSSNVINLSIKVGNNASRTAVSTDKTNFLYGELVVPKGVTANEIIKPMFNYGLTALPYELYVEDTFNLPETLELGEYDSYNPQTGYVSRNTEYATSETGFTEDQLFGLSGAILSADGKTVAYKKLSFNGEQYTKRDTHYTAWNGGSETQVQGETDNSADGAMCTLTNDYFVKVGGATNEQTE